MEAEKKEKWDGRMMKKSSLYRTAEWQCRDELRFEN